MFVLSKIYLYVANPGVWVLVLLLLGVGLLWTRWQRAGRRLLTWMAAFLLLVSIVPVGELMTIPLEDRFPVRKAIAEQVDGIVVLGGTVNQFVTAYRGQVSLTEGAERLTETVFLARSHPEAKILFSGGSGALDRQERKETEVARLFFSQMGIDPARLAFESESRNTVENARLSYSLAAPKPGERWLLVTSAMHMPRAMGCFRAAGWTIEAYPVDYVTMSYRGVDFGFNMLGGLEGLAVALREYMGLAVYRVLGRTDTLFPGP